MEDETIESLVDDRVHGAHLQDPDAGGATYPLVVIDFRAGSVGFSSGFQRVTLELWAYTRQSSGHALEIYDACFAALHHQLLRKDGINIAGYAEEVIRPAEGYNEKVRAYYASGTFVLRASYRS